METARYYHCSEPTIRQQLEKQMQMVLDNVVCFKSVGKQRYQETVERLRKNLLSIDETTIEGQVDCKQLKDDLIVLLGLEELHPTLALNFNLDTEETRIRQLLDLLFDKGEADKLLRFACHQARMNIHYNTMMERRFKFSSSGPSAAKASFMNGGSSYGPIAKQLHYLIKMIANAVSRHGFLIPEPIIDEEETAEGMKLLPPTTDQEIRANWNSMDKSKDKSTDPLRILVAHRLQAMGVKATTSMKTTKRFNRIPARWKHKIQIA